MSPRSLRALKPLEGQRVCLSLRDGRRLDDCELVSVGRRPKQTLWVFVNGSDAFVPIDDVIDIWEAA